MPEVNHYIAGEKTNSIGGDMNKPSGHNINLSKVVSAGLAGLAGGAAIATAIIGGAGITVALAGSLVGAAITGSAEYKREKREKVAQ